ncbi:MAG: GNAT family N-acetyltransferase [Anaerolineae bacterium]|nr:GNAT family N-acetyltransferase [Anaerolineae bacterium]
MKMPHYDIRLLESPEEMRLIERLADDIWRGGPLDVVPAHIILAFVHNGGLAIGAFQDEEMVGFVFGFPGISIIGQETRIKLCSHQMGVHPDHRGKDLGFMLKKAQWQRVRQAGIDQITWTYDPLLSKNAYLNIARLGAVCNTYKRNEYGDMVDELNAGVASDRFQIDWWTHTKRVSQRLDEENRTVPGLRNYQQADIQTLHTPETDSNSGLLRPPSKYTSPSGSLALVEIPTNFQALRETDISLARDWRFFTRDIFEEGFSTGYLVTDFIYDRSQKSPRGFYILTKGESTIS